MRKFVFFLSGIIFSHIIIAQEASYQQFIEEGKAWHYEVSNPNAGSEYFSEWLTTYFLEGDTIIGDHRCKRIYVTSSCPFNKREKLYSGALFEKDSLVFHIYPNGTEPYLLYDFSAQSGNEVSIYGTRLSILERNNITYDGKSLLVLTWCPIELDVYKSFLIEGIGCLDNELLNYYNSWNPGAYNCKLLSCEVNGDEIFDLNSFNGTVGCQRIVNDNHVRSSLGIFDLQGRMLQQAPNKGIYIQNGKKVAVK